MRRFRSSLIGGGLVLAAAGAGLTIAAMAGWRSWDLVLGNGWHMSIFPSGAGLLLITIGTLLGLVGYLFRAGRPPGRAWHRRNGPQ